MDILNLQLKQIIRVGEDIKIFLLGGRTSCSFNEGSSYLDQNGALKEG
jgi:hypothetical protein